MGAENGGMIVDISEDGLGFQAVGRVEKGAELEVSFSLSAGYRISARARIAWVGPKGNSGGTTFTRLPADSRSIIREWVAKTAEAEAAREAAAAVEAEVTAPESGTQERPLIIERVETPRAPLPAPSGPAELAPETPVAVEPLIELAAPAAEESAQAEIPATEALAAKSDVSSTAVPPAVIQQDLRQDVQQNVQPDVASAAAPVAPEVAEPVAEPVIEQALRQNPEPFVYKGLQHDVPSTAENNSPRDVQTNVESVSHADVQPSLPAETPEQSVASPSDTSRGDVSARDELSADASSAESLPPARPLTPGISPEIHEPIAPALSAQASENKPRATQTPATPPRIEPPRPLFPPRDTRELFSHSPWISGQSLPEEERSHKGLIAVIVICLIVAASIVSVPYIRSHRQQIGARIEGMGRSVAGQPTTNALAPPQSSQQPVQQPSQQTSPPPQTVAPLSSAPSSPGGAISANPSSPATNPQQVPAPSASAAAPATQLHPSAPSASAGSGPAIQNPPVSPPLSAIPPAGGSTGLAAAGGQAEFQQAQKYLNGTGGVAADPAEAAELFWRSLEKGNIAAAIPLADLYLQGKGVSRSCLQARILLTTASNKGNAEATQKLAQLPENCE